MCKRKRSATPIDREGMTVGRYPANNSVKNPETLGCTKEWVRYRRWQFWRRRMTRVFLIVGAAAVVFGLGYAASHGSELALSALLGGGGVAVLAAYGSDLPKAVIVDPPRRRKPREFGRLRKRFFYCSDCNDVHEFPHHHLADRFEEVDMRVRRSV